MCFFSMLGKEVAGKEVLRKGTKRGPSPKMEGGLIQEAELRRLAIKQHGCSIWKRLEPDVPGWEKGGCGAGVAALVIRGLG
jgi:hypothetical protein